MIQINGEFVSNAGLNISASLAASSNVRTLNLNSEMVTHSHLPSPINNN